ncbi:hypothetical protein [Halarsenatibacter silvermanii]|uniref:Uncharacterized protein n=1 Tax=Halarsenatibacter silvermanii TaxID=321763 RepID=A0A1G9NV41_9FIRM|nr:hypothetical protein [Halarsenatibacter silvermanii]SDL90446.1 hypothetical protein SAMN04488692_11140 [Halarsenatibacter silvermanii]
MLDFFKSLLKKLGLIRGNSESDSILIDVKDDNCGRIMEVRALKTYDLHRIYEDELPGEYRLKKVVICDECFQKVFIEVFFDSRYSIESYEVEGGEIILED